MTLTVTEHSVSGWQTFADVAQFVPDPMILRTGEVFANGAKGAKALGRPDFEVVEALRDNIAGLIEFFDLLVSYDHMPLIDYQYTYDRETVAMPIDALLGAKALPVSIGYQVYEAVKAGALQALSTVDLNHITQFAHQLAELDALRYDWRPGLEDIKIGGGLAQTGQLDEPTRRAAQFLLGGLIFGGFAQASFTDHIIQPKRSRFLLALTTDLRAAGNLSHAHEDAVFAAAERALHGTTAVARRLDALPPVLPYLLAKAPQGATAGDLLKQALDFANTKGGDNFRKAAALIRGDGVSASRTADLAKAARSEALALLQPFSTLAHADGGLKVEAKLGLEGPSVSISKALSLPTWLQVWWNGHTPFGGLRKTFRRMWLAADSFENMEKRLVAAWTRP